MGFIIENSGHTNGKFIIYYLETRENKNICVFIRPNYIFILIQNSYEEMIKVSFKNIFFNKIVTEKYCDFQQVNRKNNFFHIEKN